MEIKAKHLKGLVVVIVVLAIGFCGDVWLKKTAPKRNYIKQLEAMRLVHEHNQLQIEIYEQGKRIAENKAEQEASIPAYELTPAGPEKKERK